MDQEKPRTKKAIGTKTVRSSGHSLVVYVTQECEQIGADYGDTVIVTVEKTED